MSLYADVPALRTRQVLGDLLVLLWVLLWVGIGKAVHEQVSRLAAPGRTIEDAGRSLEDGLRSAGREVARTPLVGDDLQVPFEGAGDAAASLAAAGTAVQDGVARAALLTALAVAAWPIVLVLGGWVVHRWRQARRLAVGRRLVATPAGRDLLALRTLAHAPLRSLTDEDVAGWRRADPDAVARLAARGARDLGVRAVSPPR
ncbi:hypothetical protein [Actinotalea sp. Marseille-Q4924]|uniref:hypothetical protein n=1 Tax=Actinotalea sp. Marseille-Q4924 TaxID=2866571 RepID=UPI001CE3F68C|nr:hypothetical protein [Actinotalea sp. Marseille-Q4924]